MYNDKFDFVLKTVTTHGFIPELESHQEDENGNFVAFIPFNCKKPFILLEGEVIQPSGTVNINKQMQFVTTTAPGEQYWIPHFSPGVATLLSGFGPLTLDDSLFIKEQGNGLLIRFPTNIAGGWQPYLPLRLTWIERHEKVGPDNYCNCK